MRDLTNKLRNILAVIFVILIAILAFTPLLSFDLTNDERLEREMDKVVTNAKIIEKLNEGEINEEKYKEINEYFEQNEYNTDYDAVSFIKAIPNTVKYFEAFLDVQACEDKEDEFIEACESGSNEEHRNNLYNDLQECREKLKDIDYNAVTIESLDQFRWAFTSLDISVILDEAVTSSEMISLMVSAIIKFIFVMIILLLFPIAMIFTALKLLGAILKRDYGKALLISRNTFSWAALLLAVSAIWNSHLTKTGICAVVVTIIVIVFNIVASWLVRSEGETASLIALQVSSFVSAIGLYVFISNIIKAELGRTWEEELMLTQESELGVASFVLISLFVCMLMFLMPVIYKGIVSVLARAGNLHYGISGKKKSEGIGGAITFGIIIILYNIILKNKFSVELTTEQASAISKACVGLGIALAATIASSAMKSRLQ
ncbi:MAG: hypothetical protein IJ039_04820 [Clostridia bacterium]|nr:hypothetical protein [Clostridia bacterium]